MIRLLVLAISLLLSQDCFGQSLKLYKDNKSKEISTGTWLKVDCYVDGKNNKEVYRGELKAELKDSIQLDITRLWKYTSDNDQKSIRAEIYQEPRIASIPKENIVFIHTSKGHQKRFLRRLGAVLVATGIGTSVGALFTSGDDRKAILIVAGSQVGSGILMTQIFRKTKPYKFQTENPWTFDPH